MKNEKWVLGSLFLHDGFVIKLIDFCKNSGIEYKINAVYGGMDIPWVGEEGPYATYDEKLFEEIVRKYNQRGVECLVNMSGKDIDVSDPVGIHCLEVLDKCGNTFNVTNGVTLGNSALIETINRYNNVEYYGGMLYENCEFCKIAIPKSVSEHGDIVIVNERLLENIDDVKEFFRICRVDDYDSKSRQYYEMLDNILENKKKNWKMNDLLNSHKRYVIKNNLFMVKAWGLNPISFIRDVGDFIYGGSSEFINIVTLIQGGEI